MEKRGKVNKEVFYVRKVVHIYGSPAFLPKVFSACVELSRKKFSRDEAEFCAVALSARANG